MSRIQNMITVATTLGRRRAAFLILAIPMAYSMCQAPAASDVEPTSSTEEHGRR